MNFLQISEKKNSDFWSTFNFFSHIKGLGVGNFINLRNISQGFVGQKNVRRALFMLVDLINKQNFENKGMIVTGSCGTGKSALGIAVSRLLIPKFPFIKINGSEIKSPIISKIEILHQIIRKTVGVNFYQESLIIEGEVVDLKINEKNKKNIERKLVIRNQNIQSIYEIGPKIYKKFFEKNIKKGDFVSIDKINGEVYFHEKNSEKNNLKENQNSSKEKFPSLEKYRIIEHFVTLHEIDLLNSKKKSLSTIFSDSQSEINFKKREKIGKILKRWEEEKKIKIFKGILFIDDIHLLDSQSFSFLGKIIETKFSPNFFFATNCPREKIKELNYISPHGIPVDFLDRFLILSTYPPSKIEIEQIIKIKSKNLRVSLRKECLLLLVKIGVECGLTHALYLLVTFCFHSMENEKEAGINEILISFKLFLNFRKIIRNTNLPKYFLFEKK
mmetsp:Transcript_12573/g.32433  ORF Transcript_12573/g.32433 Transcript_12573/m.32433 type:complete len:444 (-) Transcript_12573:176-1507(-)